MKLRNKIYYGLKPFVPRAVRLAIRRKLALRVRNRSLNVWPIMPGSECPPEGWSGWPNGKKLAVVLTHDVESGVGLNRVRQVAELEISLGFRSSFNLIPEGSYRVPKELLTWLVTHGFEVGVHDLHHDGKLYRNRSDFVRKSRRINHYLKEWNALGFRSGFMLNRLEWLHDLNIQYDASTFDTDPFEPQPDGMGTIFPFWVSAPNIMKSARGGYVELPYTLPQDSTLFRLFRETSIDAWKKKCDWIASHGGMVLVNTHPDYMTMNGMRREADEYPVTFYEDLLRYISSSYDRKYWHVLPHEVADWMEQGRPYPSHRGVFLGQ